MVIAAVGQHQAPLALGNVIGSVISNILAAFSLGLIFQRGDIEFDRSSKIYVTLLLLLTPPIIALVYFHKGGVILGSTLIAAFGIYLLSIGAAIFRGVLAAPEPEDSSDTDSDSDSDIHGPSRLNNHSPTTARPEIANSDENQALLAGPSSPRPLLTHILQLVLGFLALSLAGYILSHSATSIASELHLSGTIFGLTILAFATTLPEKFLAVIGASRGHSGIVVANTVGSNIFLLTLCLGVVYVSGDEVRTIAPFELAVALGSVVALAGVVFLGARRWMGAGLLVAYVVFLGLEFTMFRR